MILAGTFSKNMIPSLLLGYLLVPEILYPSIIATKERFMMRTPVEPQTAMVHFMRSGAFLRHIASIKRLCRDKYFRLTGSLRDAFGGAMRVNNNAVGLYVHVAHSRHDFS